VEVNSETDFVTRDLGFQGFANTVLDASFAAKQTDMAAVMAGDLKLLVKLWCRKCGENVSARTSLASIEAPVVGGYVHSNNAHCCYRRSDGGE